MNTLQKSVSPPFPPFLELLDRYEGHLRQAGKRVRRSPREEGERLFSSLSDEHRQRLVTRLELELRLFDEILAAGEKLTDSPRLLWRYLRAIGYVPSADIFGHITDGDIVEIYGAEQIHLFQNLNFFDWVSVTLEELYCTPWYQISSRDPEIEKQLYEVTVKVFSGEITNTFSPNVPWHKIKELGEDQFELELLIKWISPIVLNQRVVALIAVNEARNLRSLPSAP